MLEGLREELGQRDLAVEGLNATVGALVQARVAALLIADVGDARLWVGDDPMQLAAKPDDLRALGVEAPREVDAVDALIRAALASGAGVRLYDTRDPDGPLALDPAAAPRDGVGALLRWADGGTS